MFVNLLILLFSYVFISFSVLLCCKSLTRKCSLKGGIKQKEDVVPISALNRTRTSIEQVETRLSVPTLEPKSQDRAHSTSD